MSTRARLLSPLLAPLLACAIGAPPEASGGGPPEASSDASTGVATSQPGTSAASTSLEASSTGAVDPTTAAVSETSGAGESSSASTSTSDGDGCGGACDGPPGPCQVSPGACVDGQCVYPPAGADLLCDDGDPCTEDDGCDGEGGCAGVPLDCERPHASGGVCADGVCQGFVCVEPWSDCDGNWDNGCEVPTGVANQCDADGLNPEGGCWTAYCGASDDPKAKNFDGYFCYHCSNCHVPEADQAQWCNSQTGTWFKSEAGACGKYEDLVCAPP